MPSDTEPPVEDVQLPSGWTLSTNQSNHVALYHRETGRSLAVFPSPEKGWRAVGMSEYGPHCPRLADAVSFDEALDAAREEAETIAAGGSPTEGEPRDPDSPVKRTPNPGPADEGPQRSLLEFQ